MDLFHNQTFTGFWSEFFGIWSVGPYLETANENCSQLCTEMYRWCIAQYSCIMGIKIVGRCIQMRKHIAIRAVFQEEAVLYKPREAAFVLSQVYLLEAIKDWCMYIYMYIHIPVAKFNGCLNRNLTFCENHQSIQRDLEQSRLK